MKGGGLTRRLGAVTYSLSTNSITLTHTQIDNLADGRRRRAFLLIHNTVMVT